jgi:hypothetical protein
MKYLLLYICLTFTSLTRAQTLQFKLQNKEIIQFSLEQMKSGEIIGKFGTLKSQTQTIYNVFRQYEKTYIGYDLFKFLDVVYSPVWRQQKKIIFRATDGYIQFANITEMIKSADKKMGIIAFAEKGETKLSSFKKTGKTVDPNPYYIIWTNFTEKDKGSHAHPLKWPYQLMSINLE